MGKPDWRIDIVPERAVLWLVLLAVWVFAGLVLGSWMVGVGSISIIAWVVILPFPLMVSWYSFQSLVHGNGCLRLEPAGFWRSLPGNRREFIPWDRVVRFGTGVFGDPLVTRTGVAVAEFEYYDATGTLQTDRLANNLPYSGERLARLMEYARLQAAHGWPEPPASLADLEVAVLDRSV